MFTKVQLRRGGVQTRTNLRPLVMVPQFFTLGESTWKGRTFWPCLHQKFASKKVCVLPVDWMGPRLQKIKAKVSMCLKTWVRLLHGCLRHLSSMRFFKDAQNCWTSVSPPHPQGNEIPRRPCSTSRKWGSFANLSCSGCIWRTRIVCPAPWARSSWGRWSSNLRTIPDRIPSRSRSDPWQPFCLNYTSNNKRFGVSKCLHR